MTSEISYVASPRAPQWTDLSERHQQVRQRLAQNLAAFHAGRSAKVLSIIGPYGSGKSELMAWGFRHAWTELGIPAIFVNLEALLDLLPSTLSPSGLVDAIKEFLLTQLQLISRHLEDCPHPDGVYLATDLRDGESFLAYFRDLFNNSDLDPAQIKGLLKSGKPVLFLDEIEQKYAALTSRVSADDRAPFREVFQSVEHRRVPYYLVGSFGLTSAYESVSDADTRRQETLVLPIPDTTRLILPDDASAYRNFFWWASRGRPGWARKLAAEWGPRLGAIDRLEEISSLGEQTIDTLPIVDANALNDVFANSQQNRALTSVLKALKPIPIDQVSGFVPENSDLTALLGRYRYVAAAYEELVYVDTFCDALLDDLSQLAIRLMMPGLDLRLLTSYLRMIAHAIADDKGRIAFGGRREREDWAAKSILVPLLILLQDLLLEFEGDREDIGTLTNFIDRIFERCKVIGERVEDPYTVTDEFPQALNLYYAVRNPREKLAVAPSLLTLESLFPRMVGRPLLLLHQDARGSINEQRVYLSGALGQSGEFLRAVVHRDDLHVQIYFVPNSRALRRLQDRVFGRSNRSSYLVHNHIYVFSTLSDEQGLSSLDYGQNSDLRVLERIKKIQKHDLGERRIQDFLVSLWYNALLLGMGESNLPDLYDLLDSLAEDPHRVKSQRRQLSYYRNRLRQKLETIAQQAAHAYHSERRRLFDPQRQDFPAKRLEDTLTSARDARTIEQVAIAFDMCRNRLTGLDVLYGLRQVESLKQLPKQPHGYQNFLDNHAAAKQLRGEIRPALSLEELIDYLKAHNEFAELLQVAGDLGLEPGDDWTVMTEGTENAPLIQIFGSLTEAQKVFLRGVSFQSYLTQRRDALLDEVERQALEAERLNTVLKRLRREIKQFNDHLGRVLVSDANLEKMGRELTDLHQRLYDARSLPSAVLYVLYRFSQATFKVLEEQRQSWSGDKGIEGWKGRFREVLRWRDTLQECTAQISAVYAVVPDLKSQVIGPQEQLVKEIQAKIEQAVQKVVQSLDRKYLISDALPIVDPSPYTETIEQIEQQLIHVSELSNKIEQFVELLQTINDRVFQVIDQLKVQV